MLTLNLCSNPSKEPGEPRARYVQSDEEIKGEKVIDVDGLEDGMCNDTRFWNSSWGPLRICKKSFLSWTRGQGKDEFENITRGLGLEGRRERYGQMEKNGAPFWASGKTW